MHNNQSLAKRVYSKCKHSLVLVTTGTATTSSTFKLATLASDIGLGMASRLSRCTKVLDSFSSVALSSKQHTVFAQWSLQSKLIKGQDLSTGLDDTGTGTSSNSQCTDGQLFNIQDAIIISDGANDDSNLLWILGHKSLDARNGNWWAVDSGHEQAFQDLFVEIRVGSAGQESVELKGMD